MSLFGGVISISNTYTLLFVVFSVLLAGYALGRITVKGISLGDAGVFIIALLVGALSFSVNAEGALVFIRVISRKTVLVLHIGVLHSVKHEVHRTDTEHRGVGIETMKQTVLIVLCIAFFQ